MIDWLDKIPDSMSGVAIAGLAWFGFNYAVLAERAMKKDHAEVVMPRCIATVQAEENAARDRLRAVGRMTGIPEIDRIPLQMLDLVLPKFWSPAEKQAACGCAAAQASRKLRLEYAIHTTSFRIISAQSVASFGDDAITTLLTGVCGAIPKLKSGV